MEARQVEMDVFNHMGVYKQVTRQEMMASQGKTIQTMWIDVNKGDSERPVYRSRLVGKSIRTHADDTLYASPPPL